MATYAMVTDVALTNAMRRLQYAGISGIAVSSLVLGLLASGCASSWTGPLGMFEFASALVVLPFEGALWRAACSSLSAISHERRLYVRTQSLPKDME